MGNILRSKENKSQRRVQPKWSRIEHRGDTPPVLSSHTAVFSGDSIVIFGGYSNGNRLNDVYEFYCSTAMWKKIESVDPPSPRVGMSSTLDGDTMIIFGGFDGDWKNDLYEFSLTTKQWKKIETKGTVPCKRQGHSSNLYNNYIIIFGGSTLSPLNDLYKYNLYDKEWSEIPVIGVKPSPRHSHQTCIIQDKLYLYGGFHESCLDDFWMFHFKTSSWREIDMSTMNCTPGKRIGHSLIARNGIIFLIFGNDGRDVNNDIYEFENGKWRKLTCTGDIPRKRAHHISVVSDRMFVFGGCDGDGQMNDFYIFNFGDEK